MHKIKVFWQSTSWQLRAITITFLLIVIGYLIFTFSNFIHNRNYERKIAETEAKANAAETAAAVRVAEADKARAETEQLKSELEKVNQDLAALESSRATQSKVTHETKVVYVQSKTNSRPSIPLTGNNDLDRAKLCAELATVGIKCE